MQHIIFSCKFTSNKHFIIIFEIQIWPRGKKMQVCQKNRISGPILLRPFYFLSANEDKNGETKFGRPIIERREVLAPLTHIWELPPLLGTSRRDRLEYLGVASRWTQPLPKQMLREGVSNGRLAVASQTPNENIKWRTSWIVFDYFFFFYMLRSSGI